MQFLSCEEKPFYVGRNGIPSEEPAGARSGALSSGAVCGGGRCEGTAGHGSTAFVPEEAWLPSQAPRGSFRQKCSEFIFTVNYGQVHSPPRRAVPPSFRSPCEC